MDIYVEQDCCEFETDENCSDDSQDDPTFNDLEETRFNLSNLSIQRKSKTRTANRTDKRNKQETYMTDVQDQKSYETIQSIIQGGHVEQLKVDQCKVYLRKHGLRLSGNKHTLIQRIKEHKDIVNGGGEEKYPASSFVLNCKGNACTGDVVIFEQNVYDMFNIASRSANGPPCGTRIIAGRILKESYGAAKQQHTFTIEVLWSKGEKPLPPLHPLLIKGRNLYRLKTMRKKWEDEAEREKILAEKHVRGGLARVSREARKQKKEMRTLQRANRGTRDENPQRQKPEEKGKSSCSASMKTDKLINQPKQKQKECEQRIDCYNRSQELDIPNQSVNMIGKPKSILGAYVPPELIHQRQPLISVNNSLQRGPHTNLMRGGFLGRPGSYFTNSHNPGIQVKILTSNENSRFISARSPMREWNHNYVNGRNDINFNGSRYSHHSHSYYDGQENFSAGQNASVRKMGYARKQMCRYYPQGTCRFGDSCRFLHE